jgi:gamma-glutamyl hercynylcysteine S-oxide synthase
MDVDKRRVGLVNDLRAAREFTRAAYSHLADEALAFPRRPELNLPLWELAHVAWFQEYWCIRFPHIAKRPSCVDNADARFDSRAIDHAARWDLEYPQRVEILKYLDDTLEMVTERAANVPPAQLYFYELALRHEAMHTEAFVMSLHTLGLPAPEGVLPPRAQTQPARDIAFEGGGFTLGTTPSEQTRFVFDNEKWAHDMRVGPFAMRSALTTCGEYAEFLAATNAPPPRDWRKSSNGGWEIRWFDQWRALEANAPVGNVSQHEAVAYCAWAKRRLPTEMEWEFAMLSMEKTMDSAQSAFATNEFSDAFQNLWQWTSTDFKPYPGFAADPYEEYSEPWFDGKHKSLRGSSFVTNAVLSHSKFRNFYLPQRQDVFAGFRTCALG